jgi:hypothetical protein
VRAIRNRAHRDPARRRGEVSHPKHAHSNVDLSGHRGGQTPLRPSELRELHNQPLVGEVSELVGKDDRREPD